MMYKPNAVASPFAIRLKDWRAVLVRAFSPAPSDNIGLQSAGNALCAFLSVFPAVAAGLMVWGLFTDMTTLGAQLGSSATLRVTD